MVLLGMNTRYCGEAAGDKYTRKSKKNFSELYDPRIILGHSNGKVDMWQKILEGVFPHLHKMESQTCNDSLRFCSFFKNKRYLNKINKIKNINKKNK